MSEGNKQEACSKGTGRERRANRPGRAEVVLAEHSTDAIINEWWREGGELRPKGPTEGKAKPGMIHVIRELQERL